MKAIHSWCLRNHYPMILIGMIIIVVGLVIDNQWGDLHRMYVDATSHLCIILGEAIMVMFFLHIIVEQQNHGDHMKKVEGSIQSLIQNIQRDLFAAIMYVWGYSILRKISCF